MDIPADMNLMKDKIIEDDLVTEIDDIWQLMKSFSNLFQVLRILLRQLFNCQKRVRETSIDTILYFRVAYQCYSLHVSKKL